MKTDKEKVKADFLLKMEEIGNHIMILQNELSCLKQENDMFKNHNVDIINENEKLKQGIRELSSTLEMVVDANLLGRAPHIRELIRENKLLSK